MEIGPMTEGLAELAATIRIAGRTLDIRMAVFGSIERTLIMSMIILGTLNGKEWNLTSLALRLKMKRATATRVFRQLEREGYISITSRGKSKRLHATDLAIRRALPAGRRIADVIVKGADEVRTIRANPAKRSD
jgi:DNA-binding MarR family transcriptional regulator